MKKIILLTGIAVLGLSSMKAQNPKPLVDRDPASDSIAVIPEQDTTQRQILGDAPESVDTSGDTTRLRLGKKGIIIIEKDGKTTVHIDKADEENDDKNYGDHQDKEYKYKKEYDFDSDDDDWDFKKKNKAPKFRPHFAGLELNLNNFVTSSNSMSLPTSSQFMELNTSRSIGVRLNIFEYGIPFTSENGLVTGLGFEFNSYYFSNDNNIKKENGQIVAKPKPDGAGPYDKNKLKDTYLNVPLLYEIQFPLGNAKRPLYFSFGVIGGIKIGSTTKEYYNMQNEGEKKIKISDDFYLSPFRYGFQAKVGFRRIHLVGSYMVSPLFQKGKGPELYPFDIGLVVLNF